MGGIPSPRRRMPRNPHPAPQRLPKQTSPDLPIPTRLPGPQRRRISIRHHRRQHRPLAEPPRTRRSPRLRRHPHTHRMADHRHDFPRDRRMDALQRCVRAACQAADCAFAAARRLGNARVTDTWSIPPEFSRQSSDELLGMCGNRVWRAALPNNVRAEREMLGRDCQCVLVGSGRRSDAQIERSATSSHQFQPCV